MGLHGASIQAWQGGAVGEGVARKAQAGSVGGEHNELLGEVLKAAKAGRRAMARHFAASHAAHMSGYYDASMLHQEVGGGQAVRWWQVWAGKSEAGCEA